MRATLRMKSRQELLLDALVAAVWVVMAAAYLAKALAGGDFLDLGLLAYYTLVAALFLIRNPVQSRCQWWETAIALLAVFWPIIALRPAQGGARLPGLALQMVGLAGIMVATVNLGRSFGIAPGDRGLVTRGLYRWVRHPLYATQLLFYLGYLIANPSWRNLGGLLVSLLLIVIRILREERILAGYARYAAMVRWRLVPFIW